MLAVFEAETVFKRFAEFFLAHLFKTWAAAKRKELKEFVQLLIDLGQARVLPHFLDLFERQVAVTVFVVEVQIFQKFARFTRHDALKPRQHAFESE